MPSNLTNATIRHFWVNGIRATRPTLFACNSTFASVLHQCVCVFVCWACIEKSGVIVFKITYSVWTVFRHAPRTITCTCTLPVVNSASEDTTQVGNSASEDTTQFKMQANADQKNLIVIGTVYGCFLSAFVIVWQSYFFFFLKKILSFLVLFIPQRQRQQKGRRNLQQLGIFARVELQIRTYRQQLVLSNGLCLRHIKGDRCVNFSTKHYASSPCLCSTYVWSFHSDES